MEKKNATEIQEKSRVTVTVQREGQKDIAMRIKRSISLGELMRVYCKNLGVELEAVRFTVDGKRIKGFQTADDVGLQDGDVIDAWSDAWGGGGGSA